MSSLCRNCAKKKLRCPDLGFGEKLDWLKSVILEVESTLGAELVGVLLDEALITKPSKQELYYLCEASESNAVIGEYLRGFFLSSKKDPERLEMAERLEQVLVYRMDESSHSEQKVAQKRLHKTVCNYLIQARA